MAGWGMRMIGLRSVLRTLDQLTVEFGGDEVYVVGPSAEYGIYQELGTSKMEANPFLEPAVNDYRRNAKRVLSDFTPGQSPAETVALYIGKRAKYYASTGIEPGPDVQTGNLRASISTEQLR